MRIYCWYCYKPVSSILPEDALIRAISVCPECLEKSDEAKEHPYKRIKEFQDVCPFCEQNLPKTGPLLCIEEDNMFSCDGCGDAYSKDDGVVCDYCQEIFCSECIINHAISCREAYEDARRLKHEVDELEA